MVERTWERNDSVRLFTFVEGVCSLMCPENERKLREREGLLHVLEMKRGTERNRPPTADPSRCVKCFVRSAAGQERQPASDLRPPNVLCRTVHHLLNNVVADSRYEWHVVYEFVSDRLRAVRQDMIIQGMCAKVSISLLQPMVRFYAYAGYRLCEEPLAKFDPKINHTHLVECVKTLLSLYDEEDGAHARHASAVEEGASARTVPDSCTLSKDRAEMEALYMALNLGTAPVISRSIKLGLHHSDCTLGVVLKMSLSHWLGHYVHVCRNLTKLPPLLACVTVLHLPAIRRQTLCVMSVAYSSRNLGYPLPKLASLLLYSSDSKAASDCRRYNLVLNEGSVMFDKKTFNIAANLSPVQREPFVEKMLHDCDLPRLLLGT